MFCKTVWNGLHILPDGYIRLCSLGANSVPELDMQRCRDSDGNVMHILTHEIKDIMNSDKHKEVRRLNMADPTKWSPHCDCCKVREAATGFDRNHKNKSRRIYLMEVESDDVTSELNFKTRAQEDGTVDWMPSSLDIRFGNLCNQKCIMCSPVYSNMWYDEYVEFHKTKSFGQGQLITISKDKSTDKWITPDEFKWFDDPRWWTKFEQMMPYLKHIYITGGEPMVAPAHDTMLDMLIDSGYAKNVFLEYDTNCSAINDKIAQRWVNFKKVDIRGSMDSIGDQYEIIRYPGNWSKFQTNIKKLKMYETESNGIIKVLSLTSCFQISTAYSVINSEDWCNSVGMHYHLRFLEGPLFHSIASLPDSSKLDLIEYYSKHIKTNTKAEMILKYLKDQVGKNHRHESVLKYIRFMDYLDTSRNTNWRSKFPEVSEMLTKAIG